MTSSENIEAPVEPTPQPEQGVSEAALPSEAPPELEQTPANLATNFAALSRREREQHLKARELQEREAKVEQQMARVAEYENNLVLAKENPQEFLKQAGVSMAEVINKEVSGEVSDAVKLRGELERQREELTDLKTREDQRVEQAETQRLQGIRNSYVDQITNWVDNRGDEFELVKEAGAYETVYQVLQQNYNESGSDIGFEAAAKIVNDHYAGELKRFSNTRTLKQLFEASPEATPTSSPAAIDGATKTAPSIKTLSNTQAVATTSTEPRVLTHKEKLAKFAEGLKWQ
jgi:hypothetical protein